MQEPFLPVNAISKLPQVAALQQENAMLRAKVVALDMLEDRVLELECGYAVLIAEVGEYRQKLEEGYAVLMAEVGEYRRQETQAAIARDPDNADRERAVELARANDALRDAIAHLTTTNSLQSFLPTVLQASIRASGAVSAAVFVYNAPSHTLKMTTLVFQDEIVDIASDPRAEIWRSPVPADTTNAWDAMSRERRIIWLDNDNPPPEHWHMGIAWHKQHGHRIIACIPLLVGDCVLGFLGLCFGSHEHPSESRLEQCWALAQHAALALRMAEMTEAVEQAAIAREQEKVAREQVAELAKANEVLKRSLDSLAKEPSLEKFLGQVLTAIAEQFNSPIAEYWYHPEGDIAYIGMMSWQGKVYNREEISKLHPTHPGVSGFRVPPAMVYGEELSRRKRYFIIEDCLQNPFTKDVQWMPENGLYKEINVPMVLGDRCIGALIVRMSREQQITIQQTELAQSLAYQATLAVQLTRLAEEVKQAAIFEERNRLAGEIHDTLAQAFTGIAVQLELARFLSEQNPAEVASVLDRIDNLAQTGLAEARRSVWTLYSEPENVQNLAQQLSQCLSEMTAGTSLKTQVEINGKSYPLLPFVQKNLFRIGQEAITNALKYARATHLLVKLTYTSKWVDLSIRDNGCGFDPQTATDGFGLVSMSERADRIGGQFAIITQPGRGTEINIRVTNKS
ncbi:MAG: GAF domain-containing sensor histidine kinase [Coleofasciculaceae cyanobacterium SM2_3_26]|nr:GAF domain-containing sensor histidine kinase [Coleofasciculaceae cyanobacterium SM2_3_26]